ncbi:MAG TPA: hypothetical protein PLS53_05010 [Thermoanaerobaculaceae bacterium]|nr:hypothetical protein [Thermoanaerobaculaceae bacterium]HPS77496.1 hypothetical protein [Thermoanaerobaculaceae bacterium]
MNIVDDVTERSLGRIFREETTEAAMRVLWARIERYGVPRALYTDWMDVHLTTRAPTVEERLADAGPDTMSWRACERLGTEIFGASSPQAKGRVEPSNGVCQDRLPRRKAKVIVYQPLPALGNERPGTRPGIPTFLPADCRARRFPGEWSRGLWNDLRVIDGDRPLTTAGTTATVNVRTGRPMEVLVVLRG